MSIKITDLSNYTSPVAADVLAIVDVSSNVTKKVQASVLVNSFVPVGMIVSYAGAAAPSNWLLCDGSAVSRTTYAALYAVIGTAFGVGDGSTTFNVPDARGKVDVAKSSETEFNAMGKTGGEKTHTLSVSEMPSHAHSVYDPSHAHQQKRDDNLGAQANGPGGQNPDANYGGLEYGPTGYSYTGIGIYPTGGSGAHNNIQPYITFNKIIKAA